MKEEIKEKLRGLEVSIVYLFGSKAIRRATQLSDVDIGVVLKDPLALKDTRFLYNTLYGIFSELYPSQRVDIVFLQSSPLPLQYNAIIEGKILYEQDPRITADYEAYVINMYLDFKPILEYFDTVASKRYAEV